MRVPLLVKDRFTKWLYFFIGGASTLILYQISNRAHLYEPALLQFDFIDNIMPFWPWTIWIYFTEYVIFICAYFGLRSKELITKYFYSYMVILIFSVIVFVFYPVTFPRNDYLVETSSISTFALNFLRNYMDSPANCLPSLHVSSCFISSFCFWQESKKKATFYALWSVLVSISTMTTKQHYFIDVWTAVILTVVVYIFFFYFVRLRGSKN
ncbi:MAG: phosphatase PAP2 family protein [Oligoflexia bacterium]|nr:phosphatase PAP2 family protein [Oligoflexia bacterium]